MKQFLIKTSLFILLILVFNQFLMLFSSYHWGNPWYCAKIEYLEKRFDAKAVNLPNTIFFGSSRVYRQIDPEVFDLNYNKVSKLKRQSFNLGAPATFCPEVYYLYERFIKSKLGKEVDLVFIELMSVNLISKNLMHDERTFYYQNVKDLKFVFSSLMNNSSLTLHKKINGFKDYFISFGRKQFDFSHFKTNLFNHKYNELFIGPNENGYYSLDYNLKITKNENVKNDLITRNKKYLTNSLVLNNRVKDLLKYHNHVDENYDEIHFKRILSLIETSDAVGIQLVFVLPQIVLDKELINLSKRIPPKNLIDLSNPDKFPELYLKENVFDNGHLNSNGAKEFTKLLVNQYFENIESVVGYEVNI